MSPAIIRNNDPQYRVAPNVRGMFVLAMAPELAIGFGVSSGLLVVELESGSPAERAGLKPGDVILRVNEKRAQLVDLMSERSSGRLIRLELKRAERIFSIQLGDH